MLCFSQPGSQPYRIYGKVVLFLEHVCKVRALWQQIRRISRTRVAILQPYHQHFAYVFEEYVEEHGLEEIAEIFAKGVKIEVGDMLPSQHYEQLLQRVPPVWDRAFELNASENAAVRASCVEFILAGLHATDRISRAQRHGIVSYEIY